LPYGQNYPRPTYLSQFELVDKRVFFKHGSIFLTADVKLIGEDNSDNIYKLLYTVNPDDLATFNNMSYGDKFYVIYNIGLNKKLNNVNVVSITATHILKDQISP
jgi:hypothetical protein